MKKLLFFIFSGVFFFSCNNHTEIKKENILDSLFALFDSVDCISYTNKLYNNSYKGDTIMLKEYFETTANKNDLILSFNSVGYIDDKFSFQRVYNHEEDILYYHAKDEYIITDYNNLPKLIPGLDEITFSLITYVRYLKGTSEHFPCRVTISDTIIRNEELYSIKYTNPEGLQIDHKYIILLKDTTQTIHLIIDKVTALPKYKICGSRTDKIEDIVFNEKEPENIWNNDNLPGFFRERANPPKDIEAELLVKEGEVIPKWKFITLKGEDFDISYQRKYHLIVFFSIYCGPCIKEIPVLNKLSENNDIQVTGVLFEDEMSKISAFIKKHKIKYNIVINNDSVLFEKYACGGFPTNYLTDDNGTVILSLLGSRPNLEDLVLDEIKKYEK